MNLKFVLKQYIKMLIQNMLLPIYYNIYKKQEINDKLIIFADAHKEALPISMECVYSYFKNKDDYIIMDFFCDYQNNSSVKVIKSMLHFMKYYAKAKYVFICDNFLPVSSCNKRKETIVVQLWHAGGVLKKFAYDTDDDIPGYYKGNVFSNYNIITVSSRICIDVYSSAMKADKNIIMPIGISRTDKYYDLDYLESCREEFYSKHSSAKNKKIVLWAPTFRGKASNPFNIGIESIDKLEEELNSEWYVIKKFHPHVDSKKMRSNCAISTERLFPVIDILITDYSSVIFDYILFKKPLVLFVPDLEEYEAKRGLYIDYNELPATIVADGDRLKENLLYEYENFDLNRMNSFVQKYMDACDGHATVRLINLLENLKD